MAKKAKPQHILVLRFSALGDVAMTVPVLLALTENYPGLKITVVSRGFHKFLFKAIKGVDFHEAKLNDEHKGLRGLWKLRGELQELGIDAVADLHNVLRSNILRTFFSLQGLRFVQIDKGRNEKRALIRSDAKDFRQLKTTHQRYVEVFSSLGYPVAPNSTHTLKRVTLSQNIVNHIGNAPKKWIGIAPFAAHAGKMYPLQKMGKLINTLKNTEKYKIILFGGGKGEQKQLNAISEPSESIVNIVGKLSFAEELQLISNLDLMVSMDSANGHLAANYGVPVITLWGVTHPFTGFAPYGQPLSNSILSDRKKYPKIPTSVYGNKVPRGYENVMDTISEETILSKIESILEESA